MAIRRAEARKRRRYPELVHSDECRLVVLACEIGGRWSPTCIELVRHLASYKARAAPLVLRGPLRQAWAARWWSLLSVAAQDALAVSLSGSPARAAEFGDAEPPVEEVLLVR